MRLTSLKFEEDTLQRNDFAALAPSLGQLTDLQCLELPDLYELASDIGHPDREVDVSILSAKLAGMVTLQHLVFKGDIGLDTEAVNRMLPSLTALQHLDLCAADLPSDITPALAALTALTHLDLERNDLMKDSEGMASMSASLTAITGLVYLDLDGNGDVRCDAAAAAALGHSLPQSLTYLSMSYNGLGTDGFTAFSPGLQRLTALRQLHLSDNIHDIIEDGMEGREARAAGCMLALAGCLKRMPGLTSLNLSSNSLGPACIPALAGSLQLQELQYLDLSDNRQGAGGAQRLAACLPRMLKLQSLCLHTNNIGDDGFAALAGNLLGLASLTNFDISRNDLTGAAVEALATALRATGVPQAMPALEFFEMGGNHLGDGSAETLAVCLQHMPYLQTLNLYDVNFSDNGVGTLLPVLQKLDSLTVLYLSGNRLTSVAIITVLMAAMERPGRHIFV